WTLENWRAPRASRVPLGRVLADAVPLLTLREHSDTFARDDRGPGWAEVRGLVGRATARLRKLVAGTGAARRRDAERARRAVGEARHVLFVCKGNTCRSPFAAAYARTALPAVTATSTGYFPRAGRPCPAEAVTAAREIGVDLNGHRSRVLSAEDVQAADVILVFDEENYRTVAQ